MNYVPKFIKNKTIEEIPVDEISKSMFEREG